MFQFSLVSERNKKWKRGFQCSFYIDILIRFADWCAWGWWSLLWYVLIHSFIFLIFKYHILVQLNPLDNVQSSWLIFDITEKDSQAVIGMKHTSGLVSQQSAAKFDGEQKKLSGRCHVFLMPNISSLIYLYPLWLFLVAFLCFWVPFYAQSSSSVSLSWWNDVCEFANLLASINYDALW